MTDSTREQAFQLLWDVAHLERFQGAANYDLSFSEYSGYEQGAIYQTKEFNTPAELVFSGVPKVVKNIDYPLPDNAWPVMSRRMYQTLTAVGDFPHRRLATMVISGEGTGSARFLPEHQVETPTREVLPADYLTLQMTTHEDFFDWKNSRYTRPSQHLPNLLEISEYVLSVTENKPLPPLFRLAADPTVLFISATARAALKRAGISGPRYLSLRGYRNGTGDETDVPVVLK